MNCTPIPSRRTFFVCREIGNIEHAPFRSPVFRSRLGTLRDVVSTPGTHYKSAEKHVVAIVSLIPDLWIETMLASG